jgi:SAM-dependent methyltransferase
LLLKYFNEHKDGPGIWKFNHYFEIYERHFGRFRGKEVHVLEIGIFSGGSLGMWREYFGPRCKVYGVDIEPSCKAYESESVRVFIGDQVDRKFWRRVKEDVPVLDIVIDDGGHLTEQQIVTLEELLPHLRAGGVYLCEDVVRAPNEFSSYVHGLAQNLNTFDAEHNFDDNERRQVCKTGPLQSAIGSIHLYPFVALIERSVEPISELVSPKRGSQWEPFLK